MATIEDRFQAAINVIKGLPKNGPYQPSTAMMLKFYGYYKQATEGPCHQKKPAFWDIVGKAKWDAWNSNSHLTKQQAMQKYVQELREIIDTMSFTDNVQDFVGSISGLDNIDLDDLEMISPGMKEIAKSHPNSPFNSRTNSPQHGLSANSSINANEASTLTNGHGSMNGHENISPPSIVKRAKIEQNDIVVPTPTYAAVNAGSMVSLISTVDQSDDEYGDPIDLQGDLSEAIIRNSELLRQIQSTVVRMNSDMAMVNQRMIALEKSVHEVRSALKTKSTLTAVKSLEYPSWWPFQNISPGWFVLFILWPFIVKRVVHVVSNRRQK